LTLRTLRSRCTTAEPDGPEPLAGRGIGKNRLPRSVLTSVAAIADKLKAVRQVESNLSRKETVRDLASNK
jgi:hypothetical protein